MQFKHRNTSFSGKLLITFLALNLSLSVLFQNCSQDSFSSLSVKNNKFLMSQNENADMTPPEIKISNFDLIAQSNINIPFQAIQKGLSPIQSVECQINNQVPNNCTNGVFVLSNLNDGDYSLQIKVVTQSGASVTKSWVMRKDSTIPTLSVSLMPASISGSTLAQFNFSALDNLSGIDRIECSLDNASFATCISPLQMSVTVASHNMRIRAFDKAQNLSLNYSYDWSVDQSLPSVSITAMPSAITKSQTATFQFTSNKTVNFECKVDGGSFSSCVSSYSLSGLTEGSHTFSVRGTDSAQNVSTPVSSTWIVDVTKPTTPNITGNVSGNTNSKSATFNFISSDLNGIQKYECSLNGAAFVSCSSPQVYSNLSDGSQSFKVRATDNAGNVSSTSSYPAWIVDTMAPVISFTATPSSSTTDTFANFTFSVTENGSGINSVLCSLDGAAYLACTSSTSYSVSGLSVSTHVLNVIAQDNANNTSGVASYSWSVVLPPPAPSPSPSSIYTTNFSSTETRISESNMWLNGLTDGLDWNNVQTKNGYAYATAECGNPNRYNDDIAVLKTSFNADQFAEATVYKTSGYATSGGHEIELLLHFNLGPHSAYGYEVLWGIAGYMAVVRWNGSLGDYTPIYDPGSGSIPVPADGDVFRAEMRGTIIKVYRNGTLLKSVDVSNVADGVVYSSGQPGVGFWPVDGAVIEKMGWNQYSAGNL